MGILGAVHTIRIIKLAVVAILLAGTTTLANPNPVAASTWSTPARHSDQGAACQNRANELWVYGPRMYGINRTSGIDAQTVRWRPVLHRWNGTSWAKFRTGTFSPLQVAFEESMGTAGRSDFASKVFPTLPTGYYYRVAIEFQWIYPNASGIATLIGRSYRWVGVHETLDGAARLDYGPYCRLT